MRTKHSLFHVLGNTPKPRAKVSVQWRILKPRGSLLLTVLRRWCLCNFLLYVYWSRSFMSYFVFCH